ncbi:hypothetical protein BdWA1_001489 [Babesia duncani]|uniref:Uncharacterized protein n=1 Tax=Babesia duncani TaxID=323732 RepID=A0AAD9UR33_9APIC|nr:hypothetical protein BdWA1_001489 [Babesia duncani]
MVNENAPLVYDSSLITNVGTPSNENEFNDLESRQYIATIVPKNDLSDFSAILHQRAAPATKGQEFASLQTLYSNSKSLLLDKRGRLLNIIGGLKARYPQKLGLVHYLLHCYVILYSPNVITVFAYESILKNAIPGTSKLSPCILPDRDKFWSSLNTLTRTSLETEKYPDNVAKYIKLLLEPRKNPDAAKLDSHFTWLCKSLINVVESVDDDSLITKPEINLQYSKVLNSGYELASDIVYESIKQRGNRFIHRNLYTSLKQYPHSGTRGMGPKIVAKLQSSSNKVKGFLQTVQNTATDDPSLYPNTERRHSSRRCALLRKRFI